MEGRHPEHHRRDGPRRHRQGHPPDVCRGAAVGNRPAIRAVLVEIEPGPDLPNGLHARRVQPATGRVRQYHGGADAHHGNHTGARYRTGAPEPAHQPAPAATDFGHHSRRHEVTMTRLKTLALLAGALAAAVTPSAAYYHYVHYLNSSQPYSVIFEKFDLTALPDKTVTFFVSDSGPTSYTPNDSFPSVLAQIRNATQVWNSVASSDLRVAFGGLQIAKTPQSVPTGEVVFEDLPPGVLAFAGHAVPTAVADGAQFVPILGSLIHLNINLTQQPGAASTEGYTGPSYSELFFTVLVHEIGHAIGLQHTFTSATMSTAVSRATNRARPLDADDIAGVSLLYPRGGFPVGYGSIGGRVTMGGQGVHLASVVAILPNGSA